MLLLIKGLLKGLEIFFMGFKNKNSHNSIMQCYFASQELKYFLVTCKSLY